MEVQVTRVRGTTVSGGDIEGRDIARSDLISWTSIWVGVLTAFGLFVLLGAVALAGGLEADESRFGIIGLLLSSLFVVVAFFAGGFNAAWTADLEEPESAIMHGFLVWALFVVVLMALVAAGVGGAIGGAGAVFSGAFEAVDNTALTDAAWASVFALVLAMASAILGALLAAREEVRTRWPFGR
jgi:hypothetical protein